MTKPAKKKVKKAKNAPAVKVAKKPKGAAGEVVFKVPELETTTTYLNRVLIASSVDLFRSAHGKSGKIKASAIYDLWVGVLGQPIKSLNDAPNDYHISDLVGYADFLNHTVQFSQYGLDLLPRDVIDVTTMGELGGAIVKNFRDNGYDVERG